MEVSYITHARQIFPNLGAPTATVPGNSVERSARRITAQNIVTVKKAYGRNDKVVITDGKERMEMKYKKAEPLLQSGKWKLIP